MNYSGLEDGVQATQERSRDADETCILQARDDDGSDQDGTGGKGRTWLVLDVFLWLSPQSFLVN